MDDIGIEPTQKISSPTLTVIPYEDQCLNPHSHLLFEGLKRGSKLTPQMVYGGFWKRNVAHQAVFTNKNCNPGDVIQTVIDKAQHVDLAKMEKFLVENVN